MSLEPSATPWTSRVSPPLTVGILSTYPPTAVRAGDLQCRARRRAGGSRRARCASFESSDGSPSASHLVVGELDNGRPASVAAAADLLNQCDVAIVQHEYGVYGGADGDEVVAILGSLRVPSIVIAHTVLSRADSTPAVGARRGRGARRPCGRHVRRRTGPALRAASTSTPTKIDTIPHGAAVPPPRSQQPRPAAADPAHLGPGRPRQGDRAGDRRHAASPEALGAPSLPRGRQHPPEGARRRRRGLPQRSHRAGVAKRRRRLRRVRRGLPRRTDAHGDDPVLRRRRPPLRLTRPGHLRCARRRHRRGTTRDRHRLPACRRDARQRGRDHRRPRRPGRHGGRADRDS